MQQALEVASAEGLERQREGRSVEAVLAACPVRNPRSRIVVADEFLLIAAPPAGGSWLAELGKSVAIFGLALGATFLTMLAVLGAGYELDSGLWGGSLGIFVALGVMIGVCVVVMVMVYKVALHKDTFFEQRLRLSAQGVLLEKRTIGGLRWGRVASWFVPVEHLELALELEEGAARGVMVRHKKTGEGRVFGPWIADFYGEGKDQRIGRIELAWVLDIVRAYYARQKVVD